MLAVDLEGSRVIVNEWGEKLIKGWNECHWMNQPVRVGNKIARILKAENDSIILGETLSFKLYQALGIALDLNNERKVVLTDSGNFPSDLYIAKGLLDTLNDNLELRIVRPEEVEGAITEDIAAVMLTQVDYRTGRIHDLELITKRTHDCGALMLWDLAHSAGALPINLKASNCELAVGCTYKYLNGGPGAPGFIYVRPDIIKKCSPKIRGWLGHKSPFAFEREFKKAETIDAMRVGTPPVIQLSILEKALDVWNNIEISDLRDKSIELSELFISEMEKKCPQIKLASPRNSEIRGSQVSFFFDDGYAVIQALIDEGVIGDFRAPNIMRFGITPLYINEDDILNAVTCLERILRQDIWK